MTETSDLGHLAVWILIEVMVTHCSRRCIMLLKGANLMQNCIYKSQVEILGPKIKLKLVLAKSGANIEFSAPRKKAIHPKIHDLTQSGFSRFRDWFVDLISGIF